MAVSIKANEVAMSGVTAVTLVAAPGAATTRAIDKDAAGIHNNDSVAHDFTFQKNKGGTLTVLFKATAVAVGGFIVLPKKVALDATDESLEVFMDAAFTTTNPRADATFLEIT